MRFTEELDTVNFRNALMFWNVAVFVPRFTWAAEKLPFANEPSCVEGMDTVMVSPVRVPMDEG